ncbi:MULTISPECIES: hypothetical protein [unclassified Streptomyces]
MSPEDSGSHRAPQLKDQLSLYGRYLIESLLLRMPIPPSTPPN